MVPALQAIAVGLALRFLVPIPAGITAQVSLGELGGERVRGEGVRERGEGGKG